MRVRVRSWHGVASWLWVANDENCGICRMAFNGCCPDCECGTGHRAARTAHRAGLTVCPCCSRCSSTAPCAARSGSSASDGGTGNGGAPVPAPRGPA
ncbi:anaphase-promoting complex subunit 11 isoform X1 [Myiozetetes cayanensis]|uniref:anaphase-promoting complex subunit 11 isoform X1 n=1 Tax=Myiozetetes cayanensis TaxID=478635 RepID=UPI00215EEDBC|nr:anaphase-promoting complex subunit 11 isoform X1 [Myiozetetes cayanensis]